MVASNYASLKYIYSFLTLCLLKRTKYYETVASIQALISNPVGVSTSEAVQTATEHATITQVHLKKLRQLQQTMGVVSEKVDKELKLKATEIEVTKEKLCSQIKLVSSKETEMHHHYLYVFDVSQEKRSR